MGGEEAHPWPVVPIGSVLTGVEYGLSHASTSDGAVPIIGMKDMQAGRVEGHDWARANVSSAERTRYRLRRGDLLLNRTNSPDLVGKVSLWDRDEEAVFASYLVRLHTDCSKADPWFLNAHLNSEGGQAALRQLATRAVSQANINPTTFREHYRLALPPLPEQQRIAAVLDAWDEAIALNERLVEAKRLLVRGVVDRLINERMDQRREFGEFVNLRKAKVDVTAVDPSTRVIELEDVEGGSGRLLRQRGPKGLSGQRAVYEPGDVLFAKLRPYLRKFLHADHPGLASTEMWVLAADASACTPRYLYYLVRSRAFAAEANRPTGSRMPRADWNCVGEAPVHLPPLSEQEQTTETLDALSDEIDLLATRTDLLRTQKRGLMQRLLTGEVRVPESVDALLPPAPDPAREAAE